ncbi:hypothetical protein Dda_6799 [Drechslerella dactyloides]|uniref:Uncharacterized protein n=1 Tax=Drechslerella dactyloides TaxID=74499 RepID=A0AAD6NGI2_DREDA|nr:hypothetical protein Dda_6799 [Drechslerella dactyloides]
MDDRRARAFGVPPEQDPTSPRYTFAPEHPRLADITPGSITTPALMTQLPAPIAFFTGLSGVAGREFFFTQAMRSRAENAGRPMTPVEAAVLSRYTRNILTGTEWIGLGGIIASTYWGYLSGRWPLESFWRNVLGGGGSNANSAPSPGSAVTQDAVSSLARYGAPSATLGEEISKTFKESFSKMAKTGEAGEELTKLLAITEAMVDNLPEHKRTGFGYRMFLWRYKLLNYVDRKNCDLINEHIAARHGSRGPQQEGNAPQELKPRIPYAELPREERLKLLEKYNPTIYNAFEQIKAARLSGQAHTDVRAPPAAAMPPRPEVHAPPPPEAQPPPHHPDARPAPPPPPPPPGSAAEPSRPGEPHPQNPKVRVITLTVNPFTGMRDALRLGTWAFLGKYMFTTMGVMYMTLRSRNLEEKDERLQEFNYDRQAYAKRRLQEEMAKSGRKLPPSRTPMPPRPLPTPAQHPADSDSDDQYQLDSQSLGGVQTETIDWGDLGPQPEAVGKPDSPAPPTESAWARARRGQQPSPLPAMEEDQWAPRSQDSTPPEAEGGSVSTWERIRQQASEGYGGEKKFPGESRAGEDAYTGSGPGAGAQEAKQQTKEQAQREFDAQLEKERRGESGSW